MAEVKYPNNVDVAFREIISPQFLVLAGKNAEDTNGRYEYAALAAAPGKIAEHTAEIKFQHGPLADGINGVFSNVLLAILIDHLKSLQEGPYRNRQTAIAITHLEEAENALARRADERKTQGILGQHVKEAA